MKKPIIMMGKDWWLTLALIKETDKEEVLIDDILSGTMLSRNGLRNRLGEMIGIGLLEKGHGLPSKHGRDLNTYKLTSLALDALDEFNEKVQNEKDAEHFYLKSGQRAQIDKTQSSNDVDIRKSRHGESEMRFFSERATAEVIKTYQRPATINLWIPHARRRDSAKRTARIQ